MKIRILTSYADPDRNHKPGDIVDLSNAEAARFVDAKIAEPYVEEQRDPPEPPKPIVIQFSWDRLTVDTLKGVARDLKVSEPDGMKKPELVAAIAGVVETEAAAPGGGN